MVRFLWAALAALMPAVAFAQTTFTYQGRLDASGQPASGSYDMRFVLYDAVAGGTQIGPVECLDNVAVAQGLFTVQLDFGQAFSAGPRHLQIAVRPDSTAGNCSVGALTVLAPRQIVTATPVATHALHAPTPHALDAADGSPANALFVGNTGFVGIGTTAPLAPLDVRSGGGSYVRIDPVNGDLHANGGTDGFFGIYNNGPSTGSTEIIYNNTVLFRVLNTGAVGIGAAPTPGARLSVGGRIVMTPQTRYYSLHGAAFNAYHDDTNAVWSSDFGVTTLSDGTEDFVAAVTLPHGAVVTEVRATFRNNVPGVSFLAHFGRASLNATASEVLASIDGGVGTGTILRSAATTSITSPVVDNANFVYWARASLAGTGPNAMTLRAFRITYTVSEPLP